MAEKNSAAGQVGSAAGMAERMAKSKASRAVTAAQIAKLSGENHYAYVKIGICRRALEAMQDRILDGGTATGELVEACANLEAQIGRAMFA